MTKVLIIDSAATGDASVSRKLTAEFADHLRKVRPGVQIVRRDIGRAPIPHLTEETVGAIRGAPAETVAVQFLPKDATRRIDAPASSYCGF